MNKFKKYFFVVLLFLLTGCGADVNYNMHVDTNANNIQLDIEVKIDESSYEHINGGREKLIEVIDQAKPKEMNFALDEKDNNKLLFSMHFNNYQEYKDIYKKITGIESKSVFDEIKKSDVSPFKSYKDIKMNDDLSLLLSWLKNELVDTGMVSNEYKDSMINSSNFRYRFNEDEANAYKTSYHEENTVAVESIIVDSTLKENDSFDFKLSFLIPKINNEDFATNFEQFLKSKEVPFELDCNEIAENNLEYYKIDVLLNDLNLLNQEAEVSINKLFDSEFVRVNYQNIENNTFWKNQSNQETSITINANRLFNLKLKPTLQVNIDLKGLTLDSTTNDGIVIPFQSEVQQNGLFNITMHTMQEQYKVYVFAILAILLSALLYLFIKYKPKKIFGYIKSKVNQLYSFSKGVINKNLFENYIDIKDGCIEGKDFTINTRTIAKVNLGHIWRKKHIITCMFLWLLMIILLYLHNGLALLILLFAILASYINWVLYKTLTLDIELDSGKNYYFFFETEGQAKKTYLTLMGVMDEKSGKDQSLY